MQKKRSKEDFPFPSKDFSIPFQVMLGRAREPRTSWEHLERHSRQTIGETLDCHPKPLSKHFHHQQCYQSPAPHVINCPFSSEKGKYKIIFYVRAPPMKSQSGNRRRNLYCNTFKNEI